MKLLLLTPNKTLFDGEVESVTVPGAKGQFTVWERHASLITTLKKGYVVYKTNGVEQKHLVQGGFAEVKDNVISICIEKILTSEEASK
jgi:F-type H+-transporting ATPase subunit epsilon